MTLSHVLVFPAAGIELVEPWLPAVSVLISIGAASALMPPALGAGIAASSLLVLGGAGIDASSAALYAAACWLMIQLPVTTLGVLCAWGRLSALRPAPTRA
jgi:hypothetical protein